jgi:hypothetical protein
MLLIILNSRDTHSATADRRWHQTKGEGTMKQLKKLGLVMTMAAALMALGAAGSASATVLCTSADTPGCTVGHTYPVSSPLEFSQKSGASIRFTSGATTVTTCTGNSIKGKTSSTSSEVIKLKLELLTWTGCTQTVHTLINGEFAIQWIKGTHSATVKAIGTQLNLFISGEKCTYGFGESTYLGTLTKGEQPALTFSAPAKKLAGGGTCPAEIIWDNDLVLTSPHALYVVGEQGSAYKEGILCKATTTPCVNAYGKDTTIDADINGSTVFESAGTPIATCTGGTLKAKTENAGTNREPVRAPVETLSWSGCGQTTSTVTKGSLEIEQIEGTENGTVLGEDTEITLGILGTSCTYGFGEESYLGTLTGKESPVIDIDTQLPKTAGGATCPASVRWVAEYKLTELSPLYVETTEEGVLCKTKTTPCTSPYAKETPVEAHGGHFSLKGSETTYATCTGGTLKGNIPTLGGESETFGVFLEELTWTGCTEFTRTVSLGELEVERIEGTTNGTVRAKGTEVTIFFGGVDCIYGFPASTHLGTLTGGLEPTLTVNAVATRTGGNTFLCPKTMTWAVGYKFTKPAPLYLEPL